MRVKDNRLDGLDTACLLRLDDPGRLSGVQDPLQHVVLSQLLYVYKWIRELSDVAMCEM